jgi:hypothetical protein
MWRPSFFWACPIKNAFGDANGMATGTPSTYRWPASSGWGPTGGSKCGFDAFNALNTVTITGVNSTLKVRSLTDSTPTNLTPEATGNLINPTGCGAITSVAPARQVQLMARFHW